MNVLNVTCKHYGRDKNNKNNINWKKPIESCKNKNKMEKVNLVSFFF